MTKQIDADNDDDRAATSRRRFLRGGALALASGLAGLETARAEADNLPPNVPEWMKLPGDPMGSQL